jgi:hypothetical protein
MHLLMKSKPALSDPRAGFLCLTASSAKINRSSYFAAAAFGQTLVPLGAVPTSSIKVSSLAEA